MGGGLLLFRGKKCFFFKGREGGGGGTQKALKKIKKKNLGGKKKYWEKFFFFRDLFFFSGAKRKKIHPKKKKKKKIREKKPLYAAKKKKFFPHFNLSFVGWVKNKKRGGTRGKRFSKKGGRFFCLGFKGEGQKGGKNLIFDFRGRVFLKKNFVGGFENFFYWGPFPGPFFFPKKKKIGKFG